MTGKRGLGGQAPAVLAAPRRAPAVLTKASTEPPPEAQAIRALQIGMGKLKSEHEAMREALADALDGWEALAGAADQERIDALRKRWGITAAEPDDQDLTDAAG